MAEKFSSYLKVFLQNNQNPAYSQHEINRLKFRKVAQTNQIQFQQLKSLRILTFCKLYSNHSK